MKTLPPVNPATPTGVGRRRRRPGDVWRAIRRELRVVVLFGSLALAVIAFVQGWTAIAICTLVFLTLATIFVSVQDKRDQIRRGTSNEVLQAPPTTDWTRGYAGAARRAKVLRFMSWFEDDIATGPDERLAYKHTMQQLLIEQEQRRQPLPAPGPPRILSLRDRTTGVCLHCGRKDALDIINADPPVVARNGAVEQVWRNGYLTRRCRYCLAWRQEQLAAPGT